MAVVKSPETSASSAEEKGAFYKADAVAELSHARRELGELREAFDKAEAFHRSLLESLPQNVLRKDLQGRFLFANQNFCRALGKSIDQVIGKTDFDFFPAELAEKYQSDDRRVVQTGQPMETVEEHRPRPSEHRHVRVLKTPVRNADGDILGIQVIFWDVTQQRKMEKQLAFERDLLRSLLDFVPDHVYFKDLDSRFIACSKELADRLGLQSPQEAIGKTDFDFFSEQHARSAFADEQAILRTGKPLIGKVEKEVLLDGDESWMLTSKMPFRAGSGGVIGTFGVSRDITSLVQTRQQLEKAQQKYRDIFEKAVEGIFQSTPAGRYLEANPALARIYGYSSAQDLLQNLTDIGKQLYVDPKRRRKFQQLMEQKGEVHEFESQIYRRDGSTIWIAETARAVCGLDGSLQYYEGVVEDITERKRAQAALQAARDAALEAARIKSIFLANISHELRTPLNGIIGMAGILRRTPLNEDQQHFADTIQQSGLALLRLINNILDFSKIESGNLQLQNVEFDPAELAENVAELLAGTAQKKGVELILSIDSAMPQRLSGDADRLRQILNNLAGNAVKFTDKGEVNIALRLLRSKQGKPRLRFEIADTGIGIAPEAQRRIFKAFAQADESTTRKFGGTGLGLAISRQLIEHMGGRLQLKSELGAGSQFWFTLSFEPIRKASNVTLPQTGRLDGLRILLVENNRTLCRAIRQILSPHRIHLSVAHSAAQASRILKKNHAKKEPPINCLIVDSNISANRGLKLCATAHSMQGGQRIRKLLLTPVGKKISRRRLDECGVHSLLAKPVQRKQLLASLQPTKQTDKTESPPARNPSTAHASPLSQPAAKNLNILIVEDDKINQTVAFHTLKQLGYEAVIANNGLEALALLAKTPFPIIFMDCQMPELDGYQTAKRIRENEAKTPDAKRTRIIAMTANAMEDDRQKCIDAGMDDYIPKPVMLSDVEAAISKTNDPISPASPPEDATKLTRLDPKILANFQKPYPQSQEHPLAEIAQLFQQEAPRRLAQLTKSLSSKNREEMKKIAHTFKGSASNVGARRLAAYCRQLERCLTQPNPWEQASPLLAFIQSEAQAVAAELTSQASALNNPSTPGIPTHHP